MPEDIISRVFEDFRFVSFWRWKDHGNDDELFTVHAVTHQGERRTVVRESPEDMVRALTGTEPTKDCKSCKAVKPLSLFSRARDRKDGRAGRCRVCEAARVKLYLRKGRAVRGEGRDAG